MAIVSDKYRETTEYFLAFSELVRVARYRGTVTYQELAEVTGLPKKGAYMGRQLGLLLGAISEDEALRGRPMLSALAISAAGFPSDGFYALAIELGKLADDSKEGRLSFWEQEKTALYQRWEKKYGS